MPTRTIQCCRRSIVNGHETLVFETAAGQQITLQSSPAAVLIEDANGNAVRLDPTGITITAATKLTINAPTIEIAAGELNINAPLTTFSGIIKADTVSANSIVPGPGNVW